MIIYWPVPDPLPSPLSDQNILEIMVENWVKIMINVAILTRESHSSISLSFGGMVGGSQMITLDHKGKGGGLEGAKI